MVWVNILMIREIRIPLVLLRLEMIRTMSLLAYFKYKSYINMHFKFISKELIVISITIIISFDDSLVNKGSSIKWNNL